MTNIRSRTDPEVDGKGKDLSLKTKAKAEAKDMPYCPRGASVLRTWLGNSNTAIWTAVRRNDRVR